MNALSGRPAVTTYTVVVSSGVPAGPTQRCWKVADTNCPCSARGSRTTLRLPVFVSLSATTLRFATPQPATGVTVNGSEGYSVLTRRGR